MLTDIKQTRSGIIGNLLATMWIVGCGIMLAVAAWYGFNSAINSAVQNLTR